MTMDQYEAMAKGLSTRIISEREDNIKTRKDVARYLDEEAEYVPELANDWYTR